MIHQNLMMQINAFLLNPDIILYYFQPLNSYVYLKLQIYQWHLNRLKNHKRFFAKNTSSQSASSNSLDILPRQN